MNTNVRKHVSLGRMHVEQARDRPMPMCFDILGGRHRRSGLRATEQEALQDVPTQFQELHGDSFWDVLGSQPQDQLNVVICYTSKCMPCKQVKPIMAGWEEDLVEHGKSVKMFQFALTLPNKDCALAMDVRTSPTLLVIQSGEIVSRGKGKACVDDIRDYVYKHAVSC